MLGIMGGGIKRMRTSRSRRRRGARMGTAEGARMEMTRVHGVWMGILAAAARCCRSSYQ
jgi:hypothetical protein